MFIYSKKGALSPEFCSNLIETFESSDLKYPGVLYGPKGHDSEGGKKSTDISFTPNMLNDKVWGESLLEITKAVNTGLEDYLIRHELTFQNIDPLSIDSVFNLQRYLPQEGFFQWHCESATLEHSRRVLVWMIYLNDVTDRGDTEFYYQHHFESPEQGKLVIWPADFTHLHRGIASPTQSKYILTGWFTYTPREK